MPNRHTQKPGRGAGVLRISSDRDDRRFFFLGGGGVETSDSRILGGRKICKYFLGWLDLSKDFFGYSE